MRAKARIGTGVLAGRDLLVTAHHVAFPPKQTDADDVVFDDGVEAHAVPCCEVIHRGSDRRGEDISVLRTSVSHPDHMSAPLGINIPVAPLKFRSCGYRAVGKRDPDCLWVNGDFLGYDANGRLQLQAMGQIYEGMSGAPVVVELNGRSYVVGIINEGYYPTGAGDNEGLGFATPIDALPRDLALSLGVSDLSGVLLG